MRQVLLDRASPDVSGHGAQRIQELWSHAEFGGQIGSPERMSSKPARIHNRSWEPPRVTWLRVLSTAPDAASTRSVRW